jgi:dTDP-4-amino-4,6-dideoxygalactose transaminase
MDRVLELARAHGLAVVEDAAQAVGGAWAEKPVGAWGDAACLSFYPTKNLGACGEAGMIVTSQAGIAHAVRLSRSWEQAGPDRHLARGFNYRMEAIQGAVLGVKLPHLEDWNEVRRAHARRYDAALSQGGVQAPAALPWARHIYHIYAVRTRDRAVMQQALRRRGVETRVHYPVPLHLNENCRHLGYRQGDFPVAERAAAEVLSIPVHAELSDEQVETVAAALAAEMPSPLPISA